MVVLPAPFGPEQREHRPFGDLEVDAVENELVAERLSKPGDLHGGRSVLDLTRRRRRSSGDRAMDGDIAERAASTDISGLLTRPRAAGGVEIVVHLAERGVQVEPRGHTFADTDVDLAHRRVRHDAAAPHVAEADVPVGGLRHHALVRVVDKDGAVGRGHAKVVARCPDPGVAVGTLDHGGAVDSTETHRARSCVYLRMPWHAPRDDVADTGGQMHRPCLLDLDVTDAGRVVAFAERARAMQRGDAGVAADLRSGWKLDLHIDRLWRHPGRCSDASLSGP